MDSEEGLTTEDGKDDDEEEMKICFYIPALLSNSTSTVMDTDDTQFKDQAYMKETPNHSIKDENDSLYNSESTSITFREDMKDDKMCRICYGGDSTFDKLITPCLCSGSTKYAHETCLLQWVSFKGSKACELCLYNMEIHCKGIKPFWKWQKPKSCDAVTTLSMLYSIVMFMFLAMVMWIATNKCTSALCITLYCLCIVAVAYFCYCCGYLHCMKPYCRAFWDINRRWSVVGRRISSENVENCDSKV
ncbi:E3 ubiquitin- ligase MARCH1-like isoform X1 [Paramuricea clavata]|uniref:RING-type E3 ubiquitin transferase n=1 Tax=Paramuricea clavata TaxID=317549 RepID=A0A7D9DN91_PARCT|nr:E3 ubiquitin- ligase MARCH1-like isoform X1 [Paramuricea clavata]